MNEKKNLHEILNLSVDRAKELFDHTGDLLIDKTPLEAVQDLLEEKLNQNELLFCFNTLGYKIGLYANMRLSLLEEIAEDLDLDLS